MQRLVLVIGFCVERGGTFTKDDLTRWLQGRDPDHLLEFPTDFRGYGTFKLNSATLVRREYAASCEPVPI
jgi:hypothetical protein